jgi:hypothetical protein
MEYADCSGRFPLPVGERARVRGDRSQWLDDALNDTVDISKHIVVPETQHQIAACFESSSPLCVCRATLNVLAAVELYD